MTDDKNNTDDESFIEEDLDFIEEESFDEVKTTQVQQPELGAKQWLILVTILGGIGYVIYSLFFDKTPDVSQAQNKAPQMVDAAPELAAKEDLSFDEIAKAFATEPEEEPATLEAFASDDTSLEEATATQAMLDPQRLHRDLTELTQKLDDKTSQLDKLETTLETMIARLGDVQDNMAQVDQRFLDLSQQVAHLSDEMAMFKKEYGDDVLTDIKDDGPAQPLVYTGPEYVVHAVIPGRAWLKSSQGQIVTVSEGDTIQDYGKILVIDAANGVVLTSSGIAFR